MIVVTMSMGAYDEHEHERREQKNSSVSVDSDDERIDYRGTIRYDSGGSADDLLAQFKKIKSD